LSAPCAAACEERKVMQRLIVNSAMALIPALNHIIASSKDKI
jgi:hypothetical protein